MKNCKIIILLKRLIHRLQKDRPVVFLQRITKVSIIFFVSFKDFLVTKRIKKESENKYIIREVLGSKMCFAVEDMGISQDLLKTGIREPYIVNASKSEIQKGDIIVDIGANIGYYALLESRLVGDEGRVYAIEPVPRNMELLKESIKLNKYSNIETFQLAIGKENKLDYIYIPDKLNWSSMIKHDSSRVSVENKMLINVVSLDEFLRGRPQPDLIRMDVEGYETEIVKGMSGLLNSAKPLKILMEVHFSVIENEQIRQLFITLKDADFKIRTVTHEPTSMILRQPQFIRKLIGNFVAKTDFAFGHLDLTVDDFLKDEFLLGDNKSCLEILFERN